MFKTRITELLGIRYPLLQGGMAWITGWEMAAAEDPSKVNALHS